MLCPQALPQHALTCVALILCSRVTVHTQLVYAQVSQENIPLGPLATLMPLLQMAGMLNDNNIKNALKQVRCSASQTGSQDIAVCPGPKHYCWRCSDKRQSGLYEGTIAVRGIQPCLCPAV